MNANPFDQISAESEFRDEMTVSPWEGETEFDASGTEQETDTPLGIEYGDGFDTEG